MKNSFEIEALTGAADTRQAAVDRVLASATFRRSPRTCELLAYLCRHAIRGDGSAMTEHQIAVDFYRRKPGYNSSEDTIVRVQISQLRKKLQYYFLSEGRQDPIVITIPAGSYLPGFHAREADASALVLEQEGVKPAPPNLKPVVLYALFAICLVACGVLAYQNYEMRRPGTLDLPPTPALDRLWTGIFHRNRPIQVVLSDSSLMDLSDIVGRLITLEEYRDPFFPRRFVENNISNSTALGLATRVSGHAYTTTHDTHAVWQISRLTKQYNFRASIISARNFRMVPLMDSDLVLPGHPMGDPWMQLFADHMNFRYALPLGGPARLVNHSPGPGERAEYVLDHPYTGYCVVAYQPKPIGSGSAVLILGTDMSSTEAGISLISDEARAKELLARVHAPSRGPLPYFEVLVKVKLLADVSPGFEFVTQRVYGAK